jgi:hypothetical protein
VLKDTLKNEIRGSRSSINNSTFLIQSSIFYGADHKNQLALPLITALEEDIG